MTPQCNVVNLHYTKQPLISAQNHVSFFTSSCNNSNNRNGKKQPKKNKIKCVIVGDKAVGKTALAVSYSIDKFPNEYIPTAYDKYNVDVDVDGKPVSVELCDTAGEDELGSLRTLSYPGTDVFMLCFCVAKRSSYVSAATRWLEELTKLKTQVVLVGTQADLRSNKEEIRRLQGMGESFVTQGEALQLAEKLNAPYVETSAKTCTQLKEVFDLAIIVALENQKNKRHKWRRLCCCC